MGWIIFIIYLIGWHIGMYGLFKKAGIEPWKALIPFYNTWIVVEKTHIRKIWFWIQLIPIAGQFVTIWITIIWVMHFGKVTLLDHAATTFVPFIYLPYIASSKSVRYIGHEGFKDIPSRDRGNGLMLLYLLLLLQPLFAHLFLRPIRSQPEAWRKPC